MKKDASSNEVEVDAPTDTADIDAAYESALTTLYTKPEPEVPKKDPEQANKDYYQSFRTRVLLFWTMSNVSPLPTFLFSRVTESRLFRVFLLQLLCKSDTQYFLFFPQSDWFL